MVAWVHDRASDSGTAAQVSCTSSFTYNPILVINVSYLADGCQTEDVHTSQFTRWQANECVVSLFCHQLRSDASTSYHLTTTPALQFDVMNHGTSWDIF
jgi:hypothetical protein